MHAHRPASRRLRLPENYVPQSQTQALNLEELVIIGKEFEEYQSWGRVDDTPIYRITKKYRDPASTLRYYELEDMQTKKARKDLYEGVELRLCPGQGVEGGEEGRQGGEAVGKNGWDAKTLCGGDEGVGFRDDETLRGDGD